jgi:hypothetical protein
MSVGRGKGGAFAGLRRRPPLAAANPAAASKNSRHLSIRCPGISQAIFGEMLDTRVVARF